VITGFVVGEAVGVSVSGVVGETVGDSVGTVVEVGDGVGVNEGEVTIVSVWVGAVVDVLVGCDVK